MVEIVFQYRTLIGKCELGVGLDWDEIEQLQAIENAFAPTADDRHHRSGRRFRRQATCMSALLRGDRINDRVELTEIGPGGFVVRGAPYIARGEVIEMTVAIGSASYRFAAKGVWMQDDGDDYKVGLAFAGMPICLRTARISQHAHDVVDELARAA